MEYVDMLTEEEKEYIYRRAETMNIPAELLFSLSLPVNILEFMSDEEIEKQITIVKGVDIKQYKLGKLEEKLEEIKEETEELEEEVKQEEIVVKNEASKKSKSTKKKTKEVPVVEVIEEIQDDEDDDEDYVKNLKIMNVSNMTAYQNYNNSKTPSFPTYEVTLPQSGYNAKVRGMKASEIDVLKNSIERNAESRRQTLTRIVYNCIVDTGLRSFTIKEFEDYTSILDFNILLYGIMHQTYGAINEYRFTCSECGESFVRKVATIDLATDQQAEKAIEKVIEIQSSQNKEETFKNSVLRNFSKKIKIPGTDFVIEFRFSNIKQDEKVLRNLGKLTEDEKSTRLFFVTMVTNKLYIPQYDTNGELMGHAPIDTPIEIFKFLDSVKSDSFSKLIRKIETLLDDYTFIFQTPEVQCPSCSNIIPRMKVEVVDYFLLQTYKEGF